MTKGFKDYCHRSAIDFLGALAKLEEVNIWVGPVLERLDKGAGIKTPAVHVLTFDYLKNGFSTLDQIAALANNHHE